MQTPYHQNDIPPVPNKLPVIYSEALLLKLEAWAARILVSTMARGRGPP